MKSTSFFETGLLKVLFDKEIITPNEFRKKMFEKIERDCTDDKEEIRKFIECKIERATK